MFRVVIGAVPAALAMLLVGFIFFGSGLQNIASRRLDNLQAASVQQSLAANLHGTGTYTIPDPYKSAEQSVMYGRGPIATVHYNAGGYPATDAPTLLAGLALNFVVALLIGAALIGSDRRVADFGSRARVVGIVAVAAAAFTRLGEPIYYHHDWPHFIYLFVADAAALIAAGLIIARWFLPKGAGAGAAPAEPEHRHASVAESELRGTDPGVH